MLHYSRGLRCIKVEVANERERVNRGCVTVGRGYSFQVLSFKS